MNLTGPGAVQTQASLNSWWRDRRFLAALTKMFPKEDYGCTSANWVQ